MIIYYGELIGTIIYMFIGLSATLVVSNSKKDNELSKLLFISLGWALGYLIPSLTFGEVSGPHLNPMITIALVAIKKFEIRFMWGYMIMQCLGSIIGFLLFFVVNYDRIKKNTDDEVASYIIVPYGNNLFFNIVREFLASFLTIFSILGIAQVYGIRTEIIYIYVFAIMLIIGMIFDYREVSTNPIRDIFTRIIYFIKSKNKKTFMEKIYFLVVIVVPIFAAVLGALFYTHLPWDTFMPHE